MYNLAQMEDCAEVCLFLHNLFHQLLQRHFIFCHHIAHMTLTHLFLLFLILLSISGICSRGNKFHWTAADLVSIVHKTIKALDC